MIQTSPAYFTTFKQFKEIFQKEKKNIILKKKDISVATGKL